MSNMEFLDTCIDTFCKICFNRGLDKCIYSYNNLTDDTTCFQLHPDDYFGKCEILAKIHDFLNLKKDVFEHFQTSTIKLGPQQIT